MHSPRALRSSDKIRWRDSSDAQQSVHNRAPGAVSRPGAALEFQFQKYADLRKGVNNS
jgi:S-adenosylmethionine:tRNA-ribosyltransferase-isomerase (queuine synthetase)